MADRTVRIPDGMQTVPYRAPREISISGEAPLIKKDDPKQKKIAKRLVAQTRVFNLSDPTELKAYEEAWQAICDGKAKLSQQVGPNWDTAKNAYVTFLRWSVIEFKLPEQ